MRTKNLVSVLAGIAVLLVATLGIAAPASAAPEPQPPAGVSIMAGCGAVFNNVSVTGGEAAWNISCANGTNARITGWVKDTKADGKCAYIKAFANNGLSRVPLAKACPNGTQVSFDWTAPGANDIAAYLFTAP
jgi:hypothetical protein